MNDFFGKKCIKEKEKIKRVTDLLNNEKLDVLFLQEASQALLSKV